MKIEKGSLKELKQWLELNKITEVECIFPDMAGSTKGKILPVNRFTKSVEEESLKLADSVFGQTVSGKWIDDSQIIDYVEDSCKTFANIMNNFIPGEVYNVGGRVEREMDSFVAPRQQPVAKEVGSSILLDEKGGKTP